MKKAFHQLAKTQHPTFPSDYLATDTVTSDKGLIEKQKVMAVVYSIPTTSSSASPMLWGTKFTRKLYAGGSAELLSVTMQRQENTKQLIQKLPYFII